MEFDIVVIGGGPGGYVSAIRASQLGKKVCLIEKNKLGGVCLNRGCIPTKSILQSAKIKSLIERSSEFGIDSAISAVNIDSIFARSNDVVSSLNIGVSGLMKKNKITVINGTASFKSVDSINVILSNGEEQEISFGKIVIATGASPRMLPQIPKCLSEQGFVWSSTEALSSNTAPHKLLVIGSGAIGMEFASFFNSIGSSVTVVEIQERILPVEDEDTSKEVMNIMSKKGIRFLLKTESKSFSLNNNKIEIELSSGTEQFDKVLIAAGVIPNTSDLNLEKIGVALNKNGTIVVDKTQQTNIQGIYAIGDVCAGPWLAHKASQEAIVCAEHMCGIQGETAPVDPLKVPACTYCSPQIASIGLTEKKARDVCENVVVGKSYFRGNGKSVSSGETGGFVKVIFNEKTGELLGAHMVGYEVTELISIFSLAMSAELTHREILNTIFPHPTMSECLKEAVLAAFNMEIHG